MILLTYGTRPEYIKIKPIINELKERNTPFRVLFTGQHENIANGYFDIRLNFETYTNHNRLDNIIANLMTLNDSAVFENITAVMVQGDTTSVVGIALSAMHRQIPVIHLEAGLRSGDILNPFPEEYNRKIVSSIATVHLCPTTVSADNLKKENITKNVFVVGNTALDNLLDYKSECEETNKILVTLHRRENHENISEWFNVINDLAKSTEYEFILPIHPNPNVSSQKHLLTHVNVVEPMTHEDLLKLLVKTKMVITDSGGLQEECSFFNKQCLVCRKVTERPEALKFTSHLVKSPRLLHDEFFRNLSMRHYHQNCPYGDGFSAKKVCDILTMLNY
jgi:UDP-N-acetylglucosamine 2-epimerase (non-hydrolysing)